MSDLSFWYNCTYQNRMIFIRLSNWYISTTIRLFLPSLSAHSLIVVLLRAQWDHVPVSKQHHYSNMAWFHLKFNRVPGTQSKFKWQYRKLNIMQFPIALSNVKNGIIMKLCALFLSSSSSSSKTLYHCPDTREFSNRSPSQQLYEQFDNHIFAMWTHRASAISAREQCIEPIQTTTILANIAARRIHSNQMLNYVWNI